MIQSRPFKKRCHSQSKLRRFPSLPRSDSSGNLVLDKDLYKPKRKEHVVVTQTLLVHIPLTPSPSVENEITSDAELELPKFSFLLPAENENQGNGLQRKPKRQQLQNDHKTDHGGVRMGDMGGVTGRGLNVAGSSAIKSEGRVGIATALQSRSMESEMEQQRKSEGKEEAEEVSNVYVIEDTKDYEMRKLYSCVVQKIGKARSEEEEKDICQWMKEIDVEGWNAIKYLVFGLGLDRGVLKDVGRVCDLGIWDFQVLQALRERLETTEGRNNWIALRKKLPRN